MPMLSETICRLRRERGLSQEQLAEQLNVSRQAVSKWETGASVPETDKLLALSRLFQVPLEDLTQTPAPQPKAPRADGRVGAALFAAGSVCLLAAVLLPLVNADAARDLADSSALTLNGTGMLVLLALACLGAGAYRLWRGRSSK